MLEISPVLSEKFTQPSYAPAAVNFTTGSGARRAADVSAQAAAETDTRRYTKFDRTVTDAGTTTDFSFGDFLDLINPIEHIPGISSVLRSLNGDKIHPVSRVAGDILYGGVFGLGSAVFGAAGAVADCVSEASTGHDATGVVVAALLGDDLPAPSSQVAQAHSSATAQAAPPVNVSSSASAQTLAAMLQPLDQASSSGIGKDSGLRALSQSTDLALNSRSKALPLDRAKLPYGGVMAPVHGMQQAQALALSAASGAPRMGATIYASRSLTHANSAVNNGVAQQAPADARAYEPAASSPSATASTSSASSAQHNAIPQALVDDLLAMKAARQYQSVAGGSRNGFAN